MLFLKKLYFMNKRQVKTFPEREKKKKKQLRGIYHHQTCLMDFPGGTVVKILPADARDTKDTGSIPDLGRSPGEGNVSPLQYSCLENPMDRGT